ncbi:Rieske (2Fe-2S) protein [Kitasatospora sp. NPDC058965]|uniref:Rieske (2Fe-2S) protein n=1 Tax=Kitasatospora sp. NPDC058965 TaxID=3346682 RepID=UPI00368C69CC
MTTLPEHQTAPDTAQTPTRRRALLCGMGGAAALTLCGCSSTSDMPSGAAAPPMSSGPAQPSDPAPTMPTAPASTGSGSGTGTGGSGSGSGGTVLGKAADVPVGGGTVYPAAKLVVTQPQAGTFKAFSAVCTHRGCTVGTVANGLISCPCHGSTFKAEDGSVAHGPATAPLAPATVTVRDGQLVTGA